MSDDTRPTEGTQEGRGRGRASPHTPVAGHGHSLPLGRVAGIPVRVHWTFWLLVALVAAVDWPAGRAAVANGLLWIAALFTFVVAHELAHSVVARRRGARVLGIVLFPLGGLSRLEAMPEQPADELAVAIAGPLVSVVLGAALLFVGLLAGSRIWPPTLFAGSWWARLGWLNVLLGAFNMLPALPMDGGRVLRAALAQRRSALDATVLAARVAWYVGSAMIVVGFFYDFWLILIGVFVLLGARAEEEAARHPPRATGTPGGSPAAG